MKILRRLSWKILNSFPDYIAENWVRQKIKINEKDLDRFTIKVANTLEEFEQGYRLLYECYLEQGYLPATSENSLRITKYHLMPTSTMFVVKDGPQVVATLTHVIDSKLGLPGDTAVDLKDVKRTSSRVAEISALAIKKGYRRQHSIMFALTRLVYHFSVQYAGCDTWVICVSSYVDLYYRSLFFFKRIFQNAFNYQFVNNVKSSSLVVKLNELPILFKYFYNDNETIEKNLYQFYIQDWEKIFTHFPESIIRGATTPTLTVDLIRHFFKSQSNVWQELSESEKQEVLSAYYDDELLGFDQYPLNSSYNEKRKSPRRLTNIKCEIVKFNGPYQESSEGLIVNTSSKGFLLRSNIYLEDDVVYELILNISNNLKLNMKFGVLRETESHHFACLVIEKDLILWESYFEKIEEFCNSFTFSPTR